MNSRNNSALFEILITASKSEEPLSDNQLDSIKEIIKTIPELNKLIDAEAKIYETILQKYPQMNLTFPKHISIDCIDQNYNTPLINSINHKHTELMLTLIEAKADINYQTLTKQETPLIFASYIGSYKAVNILINAKADVNLADDQGDTPLFWATYNGHKKIVKKLIDARASIHSANKHNNSPLDETMRNTKISSEKKLSMIVFLLELGVKIFKPKFLLEFLLNCDQREPAVKDILQILYTQQTLIAESKSEESLALSATEYKMLNNHLLKLLHLEEVCKEDKHAMNQVMQALDDGIQERSLPTVLLSIIKDYYYPPLKGLSLFTHENINTKIVETAIKTMANKMNEEFKLKSSNHS